MKTGASFARGNSKQDYQTPLDFLKAVEDRFGKIAFDLAASSENAACKDYFTKEDDAFRHDWHKIGGLLWLNPPFDLITFWAEKCLRESKLGAKILLLTPASVGSIWFENFIHRKACVFFLRPRLSFDGANPYPKDTMLSVFRLLDHGYDTWNWKTK